jgi:hypothetical protein
MVRAARPAHSGLAGMCRPICGGKMKFDYSEAEEYEVEFANTGDIDFDDLEDAKAALNVQRDRFGGIDADSALACR